MSIYAQEIENRYGKALLKKITESFPKGFRIVGNTEKTVVVGDSSKNCEFLIASNRIKDTYVFSQQTKLTRK
jgi:hypothetical protein